MNLDRRKHAALGVEAKRGNSRIELIRDEYQRQLRVERDVTRA